MNAALPDGRAARYELLDVPLYLADEIPRLAAEALTQGRSETRAPRKSRVTGARRR